MAHAYHKVWIHLIWGTKERFPLMNDGIKRMIFDHIQEKAQVEGIHSDAINGTADHVHCLIELGLTRTIASVANAFKGESSHWVNSRRLTRSHFAWQEGYGAFSVSASQLGKVRAYIHDQERHHVKRTFHEEFGQLMKAYGMDGERP
jgi:REP element-mobilizing transposase RayT